MRLWTAPGQRRSANGPGIHIAPNDGLLLGARSLPRKWQCVATPFILNLLAAHSFYLLQSNFFNFHLSIHLSYLVLLLVTVSLCSALARVLHFHGKPSAGLSSSICSRKTYNRRDIHSPGSLFTERFADSIRGPLLLRLRAVSLIVIGGVWEREGLGRARKKRVRCATCRALPSTGALPLTPCSPSAASAFSFTVSAQMLTFNRPRTSLYSPSLTVLLPQCRRMAPLAQRVLCRFA